MMSIHICWHRNQQKKKQDINNHWGIKNKVSHPEVLQELIYKYIYIIYSLNSFDVIEQW